MSGRVTFWGGASSRRPTAWMSLGEVAEAVRVGGWGVLRWADAVSRVRSAESAEARAKIKREELAAWSLSGEFRERGDANLAAHSGLLSYDFDHVAEAEVLRDEVGRLPYVRLAFVSPSGEGVKVVVEVEPAPRDAEEHREAWKRVEAVLEDNVGREASSDEVCVNAERLCFVSHDAGAVYREAAVGLEWRRLPQVKARRAAVRRTGRRGSGGRRRGGGATVKLESKGVKSEASAEKAALALNRLRWGGCPSEYGDFETGEGWAPLCVAAKRCGVS